MRSTMFRSILLVALGVLSGSVLYATDHTWAGIPGGDLKFSNQLNWWPVGVPTATSNLFFKSSNTTNAIIDTNFTVFSVTIGAGYTGSIAFASSFSLAVTKGFAISGGAFDGTAGILQANGGVTVAGGALKAGGGRGAFPNSMPPGETASSTAA